ncbi:MAG TPA: alpha/beta hydrolase [Casimicrobiaceae bacterium]|nr:alpha/beta hydrolase [Casimicrobiaceae bacterium]
MKTNLSAVDTVTHASATVVCLHASGSSARQWNGLIERMGHRARVVAPDFYGHGEAPTWNQPRPLTLRDEASRVLRLLAGSSRPVHLIGHSYGGAVALHIALELPERVASLTLYEPVPFATLFAYDAKNPAAAEVRSLADGIDRSLGTGHIEAAAERFVTYWSGVEAWRGLTGPQKTTIASRMPAIDRHFKALAADTARLDHYRQLGMPTLLLAGARTKASTRRLTELLSYGLPAVLTQTLDGLDHMGPVTATAMVNDRIEPFLAQQISSVPESARHLRSAAA